MSSLDVCIISQCTVSIPDDAQGIEDVVFFGSCFQNPKAIRLIEPEGFFFNKESKRFEDGDSNPITFDGTQHVRLSKSARIFSYSEKVVIQD
jgi:hypothetical protein